MIKNIFTVDLEEWHSSKDIFVNIPFDKKQRQVQDAVEPLLSLLGTYHIRSTFFVLGETAAGNPELIKKIYDNGHEIASHGYSHTSVSKSTKGNFESDLGKSVRIIRKITGEKPIGYRAPMFSLNESTLWAFEILEKEGFRYDSSLFPFKSRYYGMDGIPIKPFPVSAHFKTKNKSLIEYPVPIIRILGVPFVVCGGFYFRLYPLWFIKSSIRHLNNRNIPSVIYVHPWETYPETPVVPMKQPYKFYTYYNISGALRKIKHLLQTFSFHSFEEDLQHRSF